MQEDKNESGTLGAATDMNEREVKSPVPVRSDDERNAQIMPIVDGAIDDIRDLLYVGRVSDDPGSSLEEEKRPSKSARRVARLELAENVMRAGMSLYEQIAMMEQTSLEAESQSQGFNIRAED